MSLPIVKRDNVTRMSPKAAPNNKNNKRRALEMISCSDKRQTAVKLLKNFAEQIY